MIDNELILRDTRDKFSIRPLMKAGTRCELPKVELETRLARAQLGGPQGPVAHVIRPWNRVRHAAAAPIAKSSPAASTGNFCSCLIMLYMLAQHPLICYATLL